MVVFVCNFCGTSLKKNKVESHSYQCSGRSFSCIDCNKDFDLKSCNTHKECLQEDEKYGGLNYQKPAPCKGKKKQEEWMQRIQEMAKSSDLSPDMKRHLQTLLGYDNLPRKRAKFINFVNNSIRGLKPAIAEQLWKFFETANNAKADESKADQSQPENVVQNESGKRSAESEDNQQTAKKIKKKSTEESTAASTNGSESKSAEDETAAEASRRPPGTPKLKYMKWVKKQIKETEDLKMRKKKLEKMMRSWLEESGVNESAMEDMVKTIFEKMENNSRYAVDEKYVCYQSKDE